MSEVHQMERGESAAGELDILIEELSGVTHVACHDKPRAIARLARDVAEQMRSALKELKELKELRGRPNIYDLLSTLFHFRDGDEAKSALLSLSYGGMKAEELAGRLIQWRRIDTALFVPPQRTLLMLTGDSGYTTHKRFLTLGYYDESFRPSRCGPIRWLDVTNEALSDMGFTPTHWAYPIPLPGAGS